MFYIIEAIGVIIAGYCLIALGLALLPYIGALAGIILIFALDGWSKLIGVGILALCIWIIGKIQDWWY